jgi:tripartite-type tricarboxylate transporter receptor subunit TctC
VPQRREEEGMTTIGRGLAAWAIALAAGCGLVVAPASAQSYPDRPVRLIVGFTAGSSTDITARIFAQKFNEAWRVPVTVENLPGAGGGVAAERVAKAQADGYTLMWGANGALTIVPSLQAHVGYDPRRDFAPISRTLEMASILAVNNDLPAKSFQDLIALAKSKPGKLSYASPGVGTPQHVAAELLKKIAGVDIVHVPYRGANFTDVIGGRVPITLQNMGAILPTVREGQLRGLAVTSLKRTSAMPNLPTIDESGFPGFEATSWFGLVAPAGTPPAVVAKVHDAALKVLAQPDVREKLMQLGLDPVGGAPAELGAKISSDLDKWAKVIKDAGIAVKQ